MMATKEAKEKGLPANHANRLELFCCLEFVEDVFSVEIRRN